MRIEVRSGFDDVFINQSKRSKNRQGPALVLLSLAGGLFHLASESRIGPVRGFTGGDLLWFSFGIDFGEESRGFIISGGRLFRSRLGDTALYSF